MTHQVFSYTRISDDPLQLRAGVERQRTDNRATAERRGWLADGRQLRVFEDNDTSAYRGRRPDFEQMLDELDQAYAVVAYNIDRLVRQPRELERVIDRCTELGLTRFATAEGDLDLTTDDGQLHARILVAVAKKASDDNRRRTKRALRDKAERGVWGGSRHRVPFGYRLVDGNLQLDEIEATILRAAVTELLDGRLSIGGLAQAIGYTKRGARNLLRSPTITGHTSTWHRGWDGVLDDATAADVRALLDADKITGPRSADNWLTGVLACSVCGPAGDPGAAMSAAGPRRRRWYRHARCGATIGADPAERVVRDWLFDAVESFLPLLPEKAVGVAGGSGNAVAPEQDAVERERRLEELAHDYASGFITRSEWLAARAVLQPRPAPAAPRRVTPPPANLAALWPSLDGPEKRRRALQLLERVEVRAAVRRGVFDPSRLHPVWRA